ncbi:MAG: hypothetical protein ACHRHE_22515 [Tepidisphaerales bacterium]
MRELLALISDLLKVDRHTPLTWRTSLIALCIVMLFFGSITSLVGISELKEKNDPTPLIIGVVLVVIAGLMCFPVVRSHRRHVEENEMSAPSRSTGSRSRTLGVILMVSGVLFGVVVIIELDVQHRTTVKTLLLPLCLFIAGAAQYARNTRE